MTRRIAPALALALTLVTAVVASADRGALQNFRAHLTGDGEVPARDSGAAGQSKLQLDRSGEALAYKLVCSNIDNVVAAHIHLGPPEANGPVVAFLAGPLPPGGGAQNGVLGEGTITEANLVGPLAGQDLDALMAEIRAGNAYVNTHTNDGIAPTNTGPGDFPGGEIRGQLAIGGPPAG